MCDMSDQGALTAELRRRAARTADSLVVRFGLSPWWWGLPMLVALLAIIITRVPPIAAISATARAKPSPAGFSAALSLSGPVYTQVSVDGRDFCQRGSERRGPSAPRFARKSTLQRANAARSRCSGFYSLLNGANFTHANLRGADLRGACLLLL